MRQAWCRPVLIPLAVPGAWRNGPSGDLVDSTVSDIPQGFYSP